MTRLDFTRENLIRLYAAERRPMAEMIQVFDVSRGTILKYVKELAAEGAIKLRPRGRPRKFLTE